jgi:hypothetical protein
MFDAQSLYGCAPQMPAAGIAAPTQSMGTNDLVTGARGLLDPHNPLLWFGIFMLGTVGAASVAGSVRLGKAKIGASI